MYCCGGNKGGLNKIYICIAIILTIITFIIMIISGLRVIPPEKENHCIKMPSSAECNIIPKKVHLTWITKSLPEGMHKNLEYMKEKNPEFEFIVYSDYDCRKYIQTNYDAKVLQAYDNLIPGAYKADLWRYCVMYKEGGIYLDIKLKCTTDFKLIELVGGNHFARDREQCCLPNTIGLFNAVLVSTPKHPIYMDCINEVIENVKNNFYGYNSLYPTGPGLMGNLYIKNKYDLKDIDMRLGEDGFIYHKYKRAFQTYDTYRDEQKKYNHNKNYAKLWDHRQIYVNFDVTKQPPSIAPLRSGATGIPIIN